MFLIFQLLNFYVVEKILSTYKILLEFVIEVHFPRIFIAIHNGKYDFYQTSNLNFPNKIKIFIFNETTPDV